MKIHFIAIEVCIVRSTDALVETEGPMRSNNSLEYQKQQKLQATGYLVILESKPMVLPLWLCQEDIAVLGQIWA